jgi:CheY-like chemotaxis protein
MWALRMLYHSALFMSSPSEPRSDHAALDSLSKAASDLNNLLQIMSNTSSLIEQAQHGGSDSDQYLAMLRDSIQRAEQVAADLVRQAGGAKEKAVVRSEVAPLVKSSKKRDELSLGKQCVLLVDDEQMTLTLMGRLLGDAGYRVVTAQSGFECLDLFRMRPYEFHVVLLDLTMPFMDGEETFKRLREIRADIPVVLCTGFVQQDRLDRLMDVGLTGFLRKPIPPDEIINIVRSITQSLKYSGGTMSGGGIPAML